MILTRALIIMCLAVGLAGCSDDKEPAQVGVEINGTPFSPPATDKDTCSLIKTGAAFDSSDFADGSCYDKERETFVGLNVSKCRGAAGGEFATFDYHDPQTGKETDQLFAYEGKWHSTNAEGDLYRTAFDRCL